MKRLVLIAAAAAVMFVLPWQAWTNSFGAIAGNTGSPADGGTTCATSCHADNAVNTGSGTVSVSGPANFGPGETVEITVTVSQSGASRIGFQASVLDPTDSHAGTLTVTDSQNTQLTSGNTNFITHRGAPSGQSSRSFTFDWTAPDPAPELVTMYVAGNAANGNFNTTGDRIYTAEFNMTRSSGTALEPELIPSHFALESAYPNPVARQAFVVVNLAGPDQVSVSLIDLLGRERRGREYLSLGAGTHTLPLSVNGLPAGAYLLVVETGDGERASRRLTVTR